MTAQGFPGVAGEHLLASLPRETARGMLVTARNNPGFDVVTDDLAAHRRVAVTWTGSGWEVRECR